MIYVTEKGMFVQRLRGERERADGPREGSPWRAQQGQCGEGGRAVQARRLRGGCCGQRDEKELFKHFKLEIIFEKQSPENVDKNKIRKYSSSKRSEELGPSCCDTVRERLAGDLSSHGLLCDP